MAKGPKSQRAKWPRGRGATCFTRSNTFLNPVGHLFQHVPGSDAMQARMYPVPKDIRKKVSRGVGQGRVGGEGGKEKQSASVGEIRCGLQKKGLVIYATETACRLSG